MREGLAVVRCPLPDGLPEGTTLLEDASRQRDPGQPFHAYRMRASAGFLQLAVPRGSGGSLVAEARGIGAIRVSWPPASVEDSFVACEEMGWEWVYTGLHGRVVGTPVADAGVFGCVNGPIEVEPDGTFYADIPTRPCELYLEAHKDGLRASSPRIHLSPRPGEDLEVTLRYPTDEDWRPWTEAELAEAGLKQEVATRLCTQLQEQLDANEESEMWADHKDLCVERFLKISARIDAAEAIAR